VKSLASLDPANVLAIFNDLSKHFVNIQAVGRKVAKVTPDVYNAIIDHPSATTSKHSGANIDTNTILMFKGFEIQEIPETLFTGNAVIYAYVVNVAKAFTGINTARTIESEDFDGLAFQGAGKAGEFIIEDNKKAVVRVDMVTIPTP